MPVLPHQGNDGSSSSEADQDDPGWLPENDDDVANKRGDNDGEADPVSLPSFANYLDGLRAMSPEEDGKKYQCYRCGNCFITLPGLRRHMKDHCRMLPSEKSQQRHRCVSCGNTFARPWGLTQHRNGRCKMLRRVSIQYTTKEGQTKEKIKYIENDKTGGFAPTVIQRSHQCGSCEKAFAALYSLRRHYHDVHCISSTRVPGGPGSETLDKGASADEEGSHFPGGVGRCVRCATMRKRPEGVQIGGEVEKRFRCGECEKQFKRAYLLRKHRDGCCRGSPRIPKASSKTLRGRIGKHHCDSCESRFTLLHTLRRHQKYHCRALPRAPGPPIRRPISAKWKGGCPCVSCGKVFSKVFSLKRHQSGSCKSRPEVPRGPYGCRHCSRVFPWLHSKEEHERRHFKVRVVKVQKRRPPQSRTCQYCGKTFKSVVGRETHEAVHRGDEKPLQCRHCEMRFYRKSSRWKHEATHEVDWFHRCRFCDKTSDLPWLIKLHEEEVHRGEALVSDDDDGTTGIADDVAAVTDDSTADVTNGRTLDEQSPPAVPCGAIIGSVRSPSRPTTDGVVRDKSTAKNTPVRTKRAAVRRTVSGMSDMAMAGKRDEVVQKLVPDRNAAKKLAKMLQSVESAPASRVSGHSMSMRARGNKSSVGKVDDPEAASGSSDDDEGGSLWSGPSDENASIDGTVVEPLDHQSVLKWDEVMELEEAQNGNDNADNSLNSGATAGKPSDVSTVKSDTGSGFLRKLYIHV